MSEQTITLKNVKSNVLKILKKHENKTISQFDIYNELLEYYNVDNDKTNTRSTNKKIKYFFNESLTYYQGKENIAMSINDAILYFTFVSNKEQNLKNNFEEEISQDNEEDQQVDDTIFSEISTDDGEYESDYYTDSDNEQFDENNELPEDNDESVINDKDMVSENDKKLNFNIFRKMIGNNKYDDFVDSFVDEDGNTFSHYVVSDPKYYDLIELMVKRDQFKFYTQNFKKLLPLDCCHDNIYSKVNILYMTKISHETSTRHFNAIKTTLTNNFEYELKTRDRRIQELENKTNTLNTQVYFMTGIFLVYSYFLFKVLLKVYIE